MKQAFRKLIYARWTMFSFIGLDDERCFLDQTTHDERLFKAMEKLESAGLTLNPDKYEFSKTKMAY